MTLLLLTHNKALHICDDTSWNDPLVQQTHNLWQEDLLDHVVEDCCASVYMQLWSLPVFVACNCVVSKKMLTMLCSRLKGDDTNNNEKGVLTQKKSWGTRVVGGTNWGIRVWEPESGNPRGGGVGEPALRNQSWEPEFGSQSYWGTRVWGQSWWVRVVGGPEWRSARYTFPSEFVVHWLLVFKHGMAVIGCWDCHENCFEPKAWWPYQTCLHCVQCCQWFMFWDHQVQFYYLAVFGEESPIHVPRQSFMGGEGERRWGQG